MSLGDKHSQYQRLLARLPAILSNEELEWPCEIIDLSLQGCLLRFKNTWEQYNHNIEAIYTLTLQAPQSTAITMSLSIRHAIDNEVGFKCEHIDTDNRALLHHLPGADSSTSKSLARNLSELTHPH